MKKILLTAFAVLLYFINIQAQSIAFSDNFESGTTQWVLAGTWGLNSSTSHSTSNSLTESPIGNYADVINISATMATGADLSTALSADLSFWTKYDIEAGFDYMYIEISTNGGTSWANISTIDGTQTTWTQLTYSLGGYVGNSNVKIRFRFESDAGFNVDGMYIDDIVINSYTTDNAPPLVLHTPTTHYQGVYGINTLTANIVDISGVDTAQLIYNVEGGMDITINPSSINGNIYSFDIPQYPAGSMVSYHIYAVDSASPSNSFTTPNYKYLAGNYVVHDNGVTDFVDSITSSSGAAMRISLPTGVNNLTTVLIRNYTDNNRPNDSILVHIWTSVSGLPGTDIVPPKMVFPAATLTNTSPMTLVDFRSDSAALSQLSGDIFIGYTVPSGACWTSITQPSTLQRSFKYSATGWALATGTSGGSDFHFRAVTQPGYTPPPPPPVADFTIDTAYTPSIMLTNTSTGVVDDILWDFGDGNTSTANSINYTYTTNGTFQVCLRVSNISGADSICKNVSIYSFSVPTADFTFDATNKPTISFTDNSSQNPNQWAWDFDDGSAVNNSQNPSHTYTANATYNVCLTATNNNGSSIAYCEDITIDNVGIDNAYTNNKVKIYPNPMTNKSIIEFDNIGNKNVIINLYNILGEKVNIEYLVHDNSIELINNNLNAGNYYVEIIINNTNRYNSKLIIK